MQHLVDRPIKGSPQSGNTWFAIVVAALATAMLTACGLPSKTSSAGSATSAPVAASTTTASGPSTSSAVGGGKFNSCSVVTQTEAGNAIGEAVTPGILGKATVEGGLACVFYGPTAPHPRDPNVAQRDSVRVVVVKGSDALSWYRDYKSKVNAQPILGYGDQAFYDGYASLSVLEGDSYLRTAVIPAAAPASLSDEKKLAAAILPNL
jgi:hypothetical protein